jgi:hypothetical protein
MKLIDNLKESLKKWLDLDKELHSPNSNSLTNMTIYDKFALYDAWAQGDSEILSSTYKNLPSNFQYSFWRAVPDKPLCKRTAGISSAVINILTNIVTECFDYIVFDDEHEKEEEIWKEIEKENNFIKNIIKAVREALIFGEGAFKIMYLPEISKFPIISFVSAKKCNIKYMYNKISEITFFDNVFYKKNTEYRLHEIYKPGRIEYKLYCDNKECSLLDIEETKNLQDLEFKNSKFIAAIPLKIFESNKLDEHGQSIFEGKTDILDMLDETFSQFSQTIRLSTPRLFVDEDCFDYDIESGRRNVNSTIFNPIYTLANSSPLENSEKIHIIQNALNSKEYSETISNLISMFCAGLISPTTIGLSLNNSSLINNESSVSQREKEKQTLYTVNKIKNALFETIPDVVAASINLYYMLLNDSNYINSDIITIQFSEYANPSFENQIATLKQSAPELTIMTPEEIVNEKYGYTITDEEREQMIERLYLINYGVKNADELVDKKNKESIENDT